MFNIQDFKNTTSFGENLILLVDNLYENNLVGYTNSISKVTYNLTKLDKLINLEKLETLINDSEKGIVTLFYAGKYIVILESNKDKSKMEMSFISFTIDYSEVERILTNDFSENMKLQFKKAKYEIEEYYTDSFDFVELNTFLEPTE